MATHRDNPSAKGVELRGKPEAASGFGKKAAFAISTVMFVALATIMYGVATRKSGVLDEESQRKDDVSSSADLGQQITRNIPDAVLGAQTVYISPHGTTVQQSGQPAASRPSIDESAEMARLLREQSERNAMKAGSGIAGFGGGGDAMQQGPGPAPVRGSAAEGENGHGNQTAGGPGAEALLSGDPTFAQNMQARKEAFLQRAQARPDVEILGTTRRAPISPYEIKASTVIPAIMIGGLNSDLPGNVIAQVSENIFDTATGQHLLIPKGTRLFGRYDSGVAYGQERALVVWERLIFPDASSMTLGGMLAGDKAGYAGLHDRVDNHYGKIIGAAILMTLFSTAYEVSQPTQRSPYPSASDVARGKVADNVAQLGTEIARKNLAVQPTLEIRPGYQLNVLVNKDMVLPGPYRE